MSRKPVGKAGLGATRARVIDLIRRSPTTVTEIADHLDLTYNAVRGHLSALERDGLVRSVSMRRGGTRPAALYELAPGVDDALSRAYMPFASHLVRTLTDRLPEPQLDSIMREVGSRLAVEWTRPRGTTAERVAAASALLDELGAPNEVQHGQDVYRIRGFGCLLAAAVQGQPHVCRAVEALVAALTDAPVRECCDRGERPQCCFLIDVADEVRQPVSP